VVLVEGLVEYGVGVGVQPGEDLGVRAGDPGGRLAQPVAVGVFPDREEQLADRGLGARPVQLGDRATVGQGDRANAPGNLPVSVRRAQVRPPSSIERVPEGGVSVPSSASGVRPFPGHCCAGVGACDFQPGGGHDCPDGVVAGRQSGGAP
jgi:hypothetical protein